MSALDTYHVIAKYYDGAYAAKQDLVDLPFYLDLARQSRGPVLEIACGTGRVLLPIARKGIEICGVDNSQPMLNVLSQNLAKEPQEVRNRITVHEGDMRNFRLNR
jgi:SAM-dependent methyltransferase